MMHVLSYYCLFTSWLICIKVGICHMSLSLFSPLTLSLSSLLFNQTYLPVITFTIVAAFILGNPLDVHIKR